MKSILIILFLLFLISCNSKDESKNVASVPNSENSVDTSDNKQLKPGVENILSWNTDTGNSLSIDNDSVIFIEPDNFKFKIKYYYRAFAFKKDYTYDTNTYSYHAISASEIESVFKSQTQKPYFFQKIGTPNIRYEKLPKKLSTLLSNRKISFTELKGQSFNGKYYFIDPISSTKISVYDLVNNSLFDLDIKDEYFEIKNFFIFDLKADQQPELFIFSSGRRPERDAVGFDVYTIPS
jgi:hypothetical protein